MLLDNVVRTSAAVAATPSRLAKIDEIAALLTDVPANEIAVAVSFLAGDLTQLASDQPDQELPFRLGGPAEKAGQQAPSFSLGALATEGADPT